MTDEPRLLKYEEELLELSHSVTCKRYELGLIHSTQDDCDCGVAEVIGHIAALEAENAELRAAQCPAEFKGQPVEHNPAGTAALTHQLQWENAELRASDARLLEQQRNHIDAIESMGAENLQLEALLSEATALLERAAEPLWMASMNPHSAPTVRRGTVQQEAKEVNNDIRAFIARQKEENNVQA